MINTDNIRVADLTMASEDNLVESH